MTVQKTNLEVYGMQNIRRLARKSHKPKRSRDFRAMEPLRKRLWRRIGFKQTETACWVASPVCERWLAWKFQPTEAGRNFPTGLANMDPLIEDFCRMRFCFFFFFLVSI